MELAGGTRWADYEQSTMGLVVVFPPNRPLIMYGASDVNVGQASNVSVDQWSTRNATG